MATIDELQKSLDQAQQTVTDLGFAEKLIGGNYRLRDGKVVSADDFALRQSRAKEALNAAKKAAKVPTEAKRRETELVKEINRLQKLVNNPKIDPKTISDAKVDINRYQQQLDDTRSTLAEFSTTGIPGSAAGMRLRADIGAVERGVEAVAAAQKAKKEEKKPKDGTGPGGGAGETTAGGGTGADGGKGGKGGKTKPVDVAAVEAKFKEMFPAQGWLWEIDAAKYPKLRAALVKAVENKAWESDTGLANFSAQLDGTDFYQELKTNKTVSTIRNLVGDVGFTGDTFNRFVVNASNFGWKEDTLKAETYKEAFRRDDTGNFLYQTAVDRIRKSNEYLQIANIGKAFYGQVADDTIRNVLTGGMTTEDVQRQQRELAKQKYGHLSNLIDQGLTMENIADGFRSRASQLLEKQPDSIDMSTSLFEQAFNYGEPGKKRMLTDGEWETLLRTDKGFNWDTTQNAKDEARQLASTIAQAFGRTI